MPEGPKHHQEEVESLSDWRYKRFEPGEVNIGREVDYIVARAQERSGHIVQIGELVLFSSAGGDAWLFDTDDRLALCLVKSGVRQDFKVFDSPEQFGIEWTADYHVESTKLIVRERFDGAETIQDFPKQALAMLRHAPASGV